MGIFGDQKLELDVLKPFIKSTSETSVGLTLDLAWDRSFEKLFLSKRVMRFSFDSMRVYTAAHTMIRSDGIDETWKRCFPKLLGTGVALKSKGSFFRKHVFEISPTASRISGIVPEVAEDDSLAKSLNEDPVLMRLVSESKPDMFAVDLSLSMEGLPLGTDLRSLLIEPREITWAATIESYITQGMGFKKTLGSIVEMLDIAIAKAVANSNRIREQAAGE